MERNVYSLVLLEDVVDAVDQLAGARGTSRSGLINQILAEYLSYKTPEEKIGDIFRCMEQILTDSETLQVHSRESVTRLMMRSTLRYRYHPTVRYVLELARKGNSMIGELKISLRTQNRQLETLLTAFFKFREHMENRWIGSRFPGGHIPCRIAPGQYCRVLPYPASEEDRTSERIAEAICAYVGEFDRELKRYFGNSENPSPTGVALERSYREYLNTSPII